MILCNSDPSDHDSSNLFRPYISIYNVWCKLASLCCLLVVQCDPWRPPITSPDWIPRQDYWYALNPLSDWPDLHLMMDYNSWLVMYLYVKVQSLLNCVYLLLEQNVNTCVHYCVCNLYFHLFCASHASLYLGNGIKCQNTQHQLAMWIML